MQGLKRYRSPHNHAVRLQLTPPNHTAAANSLAMDEVTESAESRIRGLISEHPLLIFARSSCYMCYVMKNLLTTIGAYPTVIELESEDEVKALSAGGSGETPVVFIGARRVGGLESLVGLHLSGLLVPQLVEAGAL